MAQARLLVVGAQPGGLGEIVAEYAKQHAWHVTTAGVSGHEDIPANIVTPHGRKRMFKDAGEPIDSVVVTAGVNKPTSDYASLDDALTVHMQVNAVGPLALVSDWLDQCELEGSVNHHFVAISSNSAHVARSGSVGYCASKAALSMGLRCVARAEAYQRGDYLNSMPVIYGYEPGWLEGTPMSKAVSARLRPQVEADGVVVQAERPHRIPSGVGVSPYGLARMIVSNLSFGGAELNGTMLRIDGGEQ